MTKTKTYLSLPGLALLLLCGSSCIGGISCIEISLGSGGCLASDEIDTERKDEIEQRQPGADVQDAITHTLRALR